MKAIIGLSGGVDSSYCAYTLKNEGYEVECISMITTDLESQQRDIEKAKMIADKLNVKHTVVDKRKDFNDIVLKQFIYDYEHGLTPNPCALCNREIKFNLLYEELLKAHADIIATGHYANVMELHNNRYAIKKSQNSAKDQSYLLYNLKQEQLSHIKFVLCDEDKNEIRNRIKIFDEDVSNKKDSFDLCFIKNMSYIEFIKRIEFGEDYKQKIANGLLKEADIREMRHYKKGPFVDKNGNILGYHDGIINYTIGQRKGLSVAFGKKQYVLNINYDNLEVMVGDDDDLYNDTFVVDKVNFQAVENFEEGETYNYFCKVRYRDKGSIAKIKRIGNKLYCKLENKARAITKGQSAVFYDNDYIICGGTICDVGGNDEKI